MSEPTTNNIETRVKEIISKQFGMKPEEVTLEKLFSEFSADSLDQLELVMEFEDEFDMTISDEDLEKIKTVGDIIKYIEENKT